MRRSPLPLWDRLEQPETATWSLLIKPGELMGMGSVIKSLRHPGGADAVAGRQQAGEDTAPTLIVALSVVLRHAIIGQG